ncbi:MAG: alkaline shock response membrane anchor protein AmaP [Candidatus Omnitrophica bacterium]|nr:alkaline shock response membrane anchor protein AmaP [Candidatus Omnitrophota bacterium]MBU0878734.1 alkaline shock response membrane anchor protein AmaP [Candidatus Omnitrophota bacterium]MBU0896329.1 alkaline shock response membrane anchor protein AmaP [Candidatus Omnitrophota bacterium]MBU1133750.1 alkaline shock response membrane anchor protein AmaP [Candidatus Omnitrophota bacterium]MBU1366751.1 alkaline shock response membrane anchor protein AmaP [Candidatus Omnitrophota bacterium]
MGFFTVLVYILISFFLGYILIGLSLNLIDLTVLLENLEKQMLFDFSFRLVVGLLGFLIILFCLRYLQLIFIRLRKEKSITFDSPQGRISITLSAVEEMLKKTLDEREEISHIRPKVIVGKKEIEVIIRSNLALEVNLFELTKEIQEKVKEKLQYLLGEEKEIKVKIEIRRVVGKGKKGKEEEKYPEVPFRNY